MRRALIIHIELYRNREKLFFIGLLMVVTIYIQIKQSYKLIFLIIIFDLEWFTDFVNFSLGMSPDTTRQINT